MSFEMALRLCECLLSLAILQRAAEHAMGRAVYLAVPQAGFAVLLLLDVASVLALPALWGLCVAQLYRYQGPYNGGADKMVFLSLTCLTVARLAPWHLLAELALAYLAVQVLLSYVQSGWIKIVNPDWRSGEALLRVFSTSVYPVSQETRGWAERPRLLRYAAWSVMLFELTVPLGFVHPVALTVILCVALGFHLANAALFGLNRFVWAWLATYPSLFWLQDRFLVL